MVVIGQMSNSEENENESYSDNSQEEMDSENEAGNAGWANSIAKVLNTSKPQKRKTLVLSRAKKFTSKVTEDKPKYDFEIEGEVKEEKPEVSESTEPVAKKPKNKKLLLRNKPTIKDFERERALKKIATKGVVQLFNAIRTQQKDLDEQIKDAGPLDHKKDAVLQNINKKKFLDVLMGGKRAKSETVDADIKDEIKEESDDDELVEKRKSEWSVLRDDFMTNKKLKNWDQEESDDNDGENDNDDNEDDDDSDE